MRELVQLQCVVEPLLRRLFVEREEVGSLLDLCSVRLSPLIRLRDPLFRLARQHRVEHLVQPSLDLAQEMRREVRLRSNASGASHDPAAVRDVVRGLRAEQLQKVADLALTWIDRELVSGLRRRWCRHPTVVAAASGPAARRPTGGRENALSRLRAWALGARGSLV